jgi:biotin carboxylase
VTTASGTVASDGTTGLLLVVKAGWPLAFRASAYRAWYRAGLRVAVLEDIANPGLRIADVAVVGDIRALADRPRTLIRRLRARPAGVLTFQDSALVPTARLAEALGLPFLAIAVARTAADKAAQRMAFERAGLEVPDWRELAGAEEAARTARAGELTVIKPVDRASGMAVRLVSTPEDARDAYREARRASPSGRVVGERYLPGAEVSVESIAVDGRQRAVCVTDKRVTPGPRFLELGHTVPSRLPDELARRVAAEAERACDALGVGIGVAHTEVKLVDGRPVVLEVNARPAGDCIVDLVDYALGLDLYTLAARQAIGGRLTSDDVVPRTAAGAAISFRLGAAGVLDTVRSGRRIARPGVVDWGVTAPVGKPLAAPTSNGGRIAYAIAVAETAGAAEERADEAIADIVVEITSEPQAAPAAVPRRR